MVPPHPNLNAASWAKSSPKPSIMPLMKGSSKLMAAPRSSDHTVGGRYSTMGDGDGEDDDPGDVDNSSPPDDG